MLTAILVPLASFAMVFGIIYVIVTAKNRERMLLIEKGADPNLFESVKTPSSGGLLKWGLFLVGIGMGIFCGSLLAGTGMDETAAYFSMICLFGGGGLLIAYRIDQKQANQKEKQ